MDELPLWVALVGLAILLLISAFFSISETAMMALSRLRLRHMAREGLRSAIRVQSLLDHTDRLLGTILLGNNLVNAAATALVTAMAIRFVGDNEWALLAATGVVTFLILVFAEITPKVIGATYPEKIALPASRPLKLLLAAFRPVVWFVNLFVKSLLWLLRVPSVRGGEATRLTAEELRTLVLEGGNFIPGKHRSILLNLFELEQLSVDDVMSPRARIESLNLMDSRHAVLEQLRTCYHNKLPVHEGDINRTVGILLVRKLLPMLSSDDFSIEALRGALVQPYYIPSGTPLFQQLQLFQDNQQRLGLVVDEYGEVRGLVTLEDIIEEIVGEFTTRMPSSGSHLDWGTDGTVLVEGGITLRELNRRLALRLPLDGPKTLNGLLVERLEEIPDAPCSVRFGSVVIEVVQIDEHAIRSARIARLRPTSTRRQEA
ncbi:MAG TPA: HlyC/CorC family transporter [Burkholderiaceae bacterium]|nr:HlyC/CorC family transporter [Burkholderiaceae bacterium]